MTTSMAWIAVAAGGALGAVGRHGLNLAVMRVAGGGLPLATLIANVAGSFAMGLVLNIALGRPADDPLRSFVVVGILGAFTTFSTFSLDALVLARDRSVLVAGGYVAASVILSLAGLGLGIVLARRFL